MGEAFDSSPKNIDARSRRVTLPNGAKLVLLPKKTRGEIVRFSLRLRFGDESSLKDTAPAGALAGSMLQLGTRERSRQQFADALDALRANLASIEKARTSLSNSPASNAGDFIASATSFSTPPRLARTDPEAIARDRRAQLLTDVHTIVRGFAQSNVVIDAPPLAGFDDFCRLVRDPLIWLGQADLADKMRAVKEANPRRASEGQLLAELHREFGNAYVTASMILARVEQSEQPLLDVADGVEQLLGSYSKDVGGL